MEEIICFQCGHSIDEHDEDYDGGGECDECKRINPDNDPSLPVCWYRPETVEIEYLRKRLNETEKILLLVIRRMNSGPSYWGDAFTTKERKKIQTRLEEIEK